MKKIILTLLVVFNFAFSQDMLEDYIKEKPTLVDYKGDNRNKKEERKAPTPLFGAEGVQKEKEDAAQKDLDKWLSKLSDSKRKSIQNALDESGKSPSEQLEIFERLKNSMVWVNDNFSPIPYFFVFDQNAKICNDIKILDAAQLIKEDGIFLRLKFKTPYDLRKSITDNYLNRDMRIAFAIHTQKGNEVAFYGGYDSQDEITYKGDENYIATWKIGLASQGQFLNKIKCADRKFKKSFLTKGGSYSLMED